MDYAVRLSTNNILDVHLSQGIQQSRRLEYHQCGNHYVNNNDWDSLAVAQTYYARVSACDAVDAKRIVDHHAVVLSLVCCLVGRARITAPTIFRSYYWTGFDGVCAGIFDLCLFRLFLRRLSTYRSLDGAGLPGNNWAAYSCIPARRHFQKIGAFAATSLISLRSLSEKHKNIVCIFRLVSTALQLTCYTV